MKIMIGVVFLNKQKWKMGCPIPLPHLSSADCAGPLEYQPSGQSPELERWFLS